ncbi:hypothetical protein B6U74_00810 [Candidatus Bathyarchaeota archaeon ex4484_205]|nr:MAG: hypothetical protein B6U74_00810 [Candidatus Bathyarchaeota archaeon ex4484_205]
MNYFSCSLKVCLEDKNTATLVAESLSPDNFSTDETSISTEVEETYLLIRIKTRKGLLTLYNMVEDFIICIKPLLVLRGYLSLLEENDST